jgi:hypothetical protein
MSIVEPGVRVVREPDPVVTVVVELHPGPSTEVSCDSEPGELPIFLIMDGTSEVLITPAEPPTAADEDFALRLAQAACHYLTAVRRMADRTAEPMAEP